MRLISSLEVNSTTQFHLLHCALLLTPITFSLLFFILLIFRKLIQSFFYMPERKSIIYSRKFMTSSTFLHNHIIIYIHSSIKELELVDLDWNSSKPTNLVLISGWSWNRLKPNHARTYFCIWNKSTYPYPHPHSHPKLFPCQIFALV